MFWKLIEIIVKIIFFARFSKAKKIGNAAALLAAGKPDEALVYLEKHGNRLHQSLLPLYIFTRGKIFDALKNFEEAENCFKTCVLTNPKDARADLELAILTGRQFRFDDCRTWLQRAQEKEDVSIQQHAAQIETLLNAIEDGSKKIEFEQRAQALSKKEILNGKSLGIPPDMKLLERWMRETPDARNFIDDAALLVAYGEVISNDGQWKIGLSIEDTIVILPGNKELNPFDGIVPFLPALPATQSST